MDKQLRSDLKTLVTFIRVYCRHQHRDRERSIAACKFVDIDTIVRKAPQLCTDCQKLLNHALFKRIRCPLNPKPACKHCPDHCYHPTFRRQIREVMKVSGRRLVLSGRIDYLLHLLR